MQTKSFIMKTILAHHNDTCALLFFENRDSVFHVFRPSYYTAVVWTDSECMWNSWKWLNFICFFLNNVFQTLNPGRVSLLSQEWPDENLLKICWKLFCCQINLPHHSIEPLCCTTSKQVCHQYSTKLILDITKIHKTRQTTWIRHIMALPWRLLQHGCHIGPWYQSSGP